MKTEADVREMLKAIERLDMAGNLKYEIVVLKWVLDEYPPKEEQK